MYYSVYIFWGIIMLIVGLIAGLITAAVIRCTNRKSAVKKPQKYSKRDREVFMANQEMLLNDREDFSAKNFK